MGNVRKPLPVKLFFGMLTPEPELFDRITKMLRAEYGPLDYVSDAWPWDKTAYYRTEMGTGILRKFVFCERLVDPGILPAVKLFTNGLEKDFSALGEGTHNRRINIDPGYVTEAKVVLATTKDFSHRVYIGSGIYAEVTLRYNVRQRCFVTLEYTYPDYRSEDYLALFKKTREILRIALRGEAAGEAERPSNRT
jgi:hypothetical protein